MMGAGRIVAVSIAAFLLFCNADPNEEQSFNGHETRDSAALGGDTLIRKVRAPRFGFMGGPYGIVRRPVWPSYYVPYPTNLYWYAGGRALDGSDKDTTTLPTSENNFDEIDNAPPGFGGPGMRFAGRRALDGAPGSDTDTTTLPTSENNFDEIDNAPPGFGGPGMRFAGRRALDGAPGSDKVTTPLPTSENNFDEIDNAPPGFGGPGMRSMSVPQI